MALVLTEEQQMVRDTARRFLAEKASTPQLRQLRDSNDDHGFDREIWSEMVELGWAGMAIPEAYDGLGFGYTGLGIVLEEMGRNLSLSPLQSTVLTAATAIVLGASEEDKRHYLGKIIAGEWIATLAVDEGPKHRPLDIRMSATANDGGYLLNGTKRAVLDAHVADSFIVAARTSGQVGDAEGITLFLVDADTAGIEVERIASVDTHNLGVVSFRDVRAHRVVGEVDQGHAILQKTLDIASIGLSAELLGVAQEAFERTVQYLKERRQFGVAIGSFQALQHRAADLLGELDMGRSLVLKSLQAIDADAENLAELASATKAKLAAVAKRATCEAIQMHGGIGMTDEFDIGFFIKRAQVLIHTFGDAAYHLDRYAELRGF